MRRLLRAYMRRRFKVAEADRVGLAPPNFGPVSRKPAEDVTYFDRWGATE